LAFVSCLGLAWLGGLHTDSAESVCESHVESVKARLDAFEVFQKAPLKLGCWELAKNVVELEGLDSIRCSEAAGIVDTVGHAVVVEEASAESGMEQIGE